LTPKNIAPFCNKEFKQLTYQGRVKQINTWLSALYHKYSDVLKQILYLPSSLQDSFVPSDFMVSLLPVSPLAKLEGWKNTVELLDFHYIWNVIGEKKCKP